MQCIGIGYADQDPILAKLARKGRIRREEETITLCKW